jgi:hypothetical protein
MMMCTSAIYSATVASVPRPGVEIKYAARRMFCGYIHEEIAECLLLLNRPDEARAYFALAYRELSQDAWLVEREPARITRLQRLEGIMRLPAQ